MDLSKVLTELRAELENLDAAILSLERLHQEGRRRGRPPKVLADVTKASREARNSGADGDLPRAEES
jgi:hypothetical protein